METKFKHCDDDNKLEIAMKELELNVKEQDFKTDKPIMIAYNYDDSIIVGSLVISKDLKLLSLNRYERKIKHNQKKKW